MLLQLIPNVGGYRFFMTMRFAGLSLMMKYFIILFKQFPYMYTNSLAGTFRSPTA